MQLLSSDSNCALPHEGITERANRVLFAGPGLKHEAGNADLGSSIVLRRDAGLTGLC